MSECRHGTDLNESDCLNCEELEIEIEKTANEIVDMSRGTEIGDPIDYSEVRILLDNLLSEADRINCND